jgi:alanyl-tRNA synthetase
MKQLTGAEIRRLFLEFFESKGHTIHPSQSLIPVDDHTLLWINSGVATLKKYFDGRLVPENPRITNSQKSIRTNDIENVGKTARHHTFFEMLGNFSIGDYFKKEAIEFAWEFLTSKDYMDFDPKLLYATIYPDDTEAYDYWVAVGLDPSHIVKLEGNFWEIGEGPSGPNTEIFYDRGVEYELDAPKEELYPGGENERYLEIWNLVFSQYNAKEGLDRSDYPELPNKNIDTGMGLERITSVIQDAKTNYDTDFFLPIIRKIETISGVTYLEKQDQTVAFRVIADHIRTCVFAISDGALPSNEGRGYIIRRLIRRSVKFARLLGLENRFMKELVDVVIEIMEDYYPELATKRDFVKTILEKEEIRFHETLQDGLAILNHVIKNSTTKEIDGATAFKLYDTYGFPIELTLEYAEESGLTVDLQGFKVELENQRQRARDAREDVDSMQSQNKTLLDIKDESQFIGYDDLHAEGTVLHILNKDQSLESAKEGDEVQLILDQTPFYAVSGGQVADLGKIYHEDVLIEVLDVIKAPNKQNLHQCRVLSGTISVGDTVTLSVDEKKRALTTRNHTATHLLHKALEMVLGDHIAQAGSFVGPDYLRFDFNHFEAVTKEQLKQIEAIVNQKVIYNQRVSWQEMPIADAKQLGAKALFSEKYGDTVRVVMASDFSIELCGGCHVNNTSEIGLFKIVSESGIGAGIRRIEAVTSEKAIEYLQNYVEQVEEVGKVLKSNVNDVVDKVNGLMADYKASQKEIESLNQQLANVKLNDLINETTTINGIPVLAAKLHNIDTNAMRNMVDNFKDQLGSVVVVLANVSDDKVTFMVGSTKDLVSKVHSGKLVKEIAMICGGNGGGRPDFAQAGGKDIQKVDDALKFVSDYLKNL